eukprot:6549188-Pyramimonas_sp.AAC.1
MRRGARSVLLIVRLDQFDPKHVADFIRPCPAPAGRAAPPAVVDHCGDDGITRAPAPVDHSSDDDDARVAAMAAGAGARLTPQGSKFAVVTLGLENIEKNP